MDRTSVHTRDPNQKTYQEGLKFSINETDDWLDSKEKDDEWNNLSQLTITKFHENYFIGINNSSNITNFKRVNYFNYDGLWVEKIQTSEFLGFGKTHYDSSFYQTIFFRFDDYLVYAKPYTWSKNTLPKERTEKLLKSLKYILKSLSPWLQDKSNLEIEIMPSR